MHAAVEITVDASNLICAVNTAWHRFARENGCEHLTDEAVVGRCLFDYIEGGATRIFVETMLHAVRHSQTPLVCAYRCDSPDLRRDMEMTLYPPVSGLLRMQHRLVRERPLITPVVFNRVPENRYACAEQVKRCSHCNALRVRWSWHDVEQLEELGLRSGENPLDVYYGVCDRCHDELASKIEMLGQLCVG
ncbi:hypothetical protein Mmc1_1602 [Magnetococcus marinus MC-1]|uniref:Uncharacterized protein n=1 Tax=Magnetococcus marinus (strain ATCC BAA-1437 / JCM 17883 / MC-1) TaxID=156889 RepID=A0L818_MAGMM|nr:hypothetical protein [Magnetococcus marinus]ABK44111.1 hypothetical protein Mmc1_1602 [Magnetococcus marinus MC-1]